MPEAAFKEVALLVSSSGGKSHKKELGELFTAESSLKIEIRDQDWVINFSVNAVSN